MPQFNKFGQPIGEAMPDWKPRNLPQAVTLVGRTCRLEPLNFASHADDLFVAFSHDDGRLWTYMLDGPFANIYEFREYIVKCLKSQDEYYIIIDLSTNKPVGMIALKESDPVNGVTEGGRAVISPLLKQSILSTEAQYLLMKYVFDQLGYRRYEWRSDSLNEPARKSVLRLGFTLDGIFRKAALLFRPLNNSDIAWFSITDDRWPTVKKALQMWLAPENFDANGQQIRKLEDIRYQIERKINGMSSKL